VVPAEVVSRVVVVAALSAMVVASLSAVVANPLFRKTGTERQIATVARLAVASEKLIILFFNKYKKNILKYLP
jgi:hypothetical protein